MTTPTEAELRAQIDAETDPAMRRRLICRLFDQALGLSDDEPAAPAIKVRLAYFNLDQNRDIYFEPGGPLAYTDFILGEGKLRAEISFQADGTVEPYIYLFGRDGIPLSQLVGALANLSLLLDDPRVQAAREACQ